MRAFIESPVFTGTPEAPKPKSSANNTQIATTSFVHDRISDVINSAPEALDTLNELAAALDDDANYAATITNSLNLKLNINASNFSGNAASASEAFSGSTLETQIATNTTNVDTINTHLSSLDSSMNAVEGRVDDVNQLLLHFDTHLFSLDSSMNAVEGRVDDVDTHLSSLDSSMNTIDTHLSSLDSSMNAVETHLSSLDSSMNTVDTHLSSLDASMAVLDASMAELEAHDRILDASITALENSSNNFTENLVVTNDASYNNRVLQIYGETTSVIDICANRIYNDVHHNLSFNVSSIYTDVDITAINTPNSVFTSNYIDFSNNQGYFKDSLMEIYVSMVIKDFKNVTPNNINFALVNYDTSSVEILIGTQNISPDIKPQALCFGPKMFVLKDSSTIDNSLLKGRWGIEIYLDSAVTDTHIESMRMIIKQKSLL